MGAFRSATAQQHQQRANSLASKGLLSPAWPSLANLSFQQDLPSILDPSDALNPSNTSLLRTFSLATHAARTLPCPPSSLPLKNLFKGLFTFCDKPSLTWQYTAPSSVTPTWFVQLVSVHLVSALCLPAVLASWNQFSPPVFCGVNVVHAGFSVPPGLGQNLGDFCVCVSHHRVLYFAPSVRWRDGGRASTLGSAH